MLSLTLLLVSIVASPTDAPPAESDGQVDASVDNRPIVLRNYDLSWMVRLGGAREGSLNLLPYNWSSQQEPEELVDERELLFEPDALEDMIQNTIEPDVWERDDVSLHIENSTTLIIVAPREVHEQVQELASWLRASMTSRARLHLRVLEPQDGLTSPSFITREEASRVPQQSVLREGTVRLSEFVSEVDSVEKRTYVYDWQTELADSATIAEPRTIAASTGLRAIARAFPTKGGTLLDLVVRHSEHLAPPLKRILHVTSDVSSNDGAVERRPHVGMVEHPIVGFESLAGSFVLPYDHVLRLPFLTESHAGAVSHVLEIGIQGTPQSLRHSFPVEGERGFTDIWHVGAQTRSSIYLQGIPNLGATGSFPWDDWEDVYPVATIGGDVDPVMSADFLVDLLGRVDPTFHDEDDNWVHEFNGTHILRRLNARSLEQTLPAMRLYDRIPPTLLLQGRVLIDGDHEIGQFGLPILAGRSAALWTGAQGTFLHQWQCDVANDAATSHPVFRAYVDGLAFRFRLDAFDGPTFQLRVDGEVNTLEGPPVAEDLGMHDHRAVDRVESRRLRIDDVGFVDAGQTLTWGDQNLRLELSLQKP